MADRRRINGPQSGSAPLVFATRATDAAAVPRRPQRSRKPGQHRRIFLRTGLAPSASGSAYLELQQSSDDDAAARHSLTSSPSTLKISCTVHGPKPLPRSAPFSPQLLLSTHIKFAPYASRGNRRGPVRDADERDLGVHLEAALRGVIIGDRWPKSGVDVCITVLEAEEDEGGAMGESRGVAGVGSMNLLAGCITAASAALIEAGIDCVDTVTGGMAAVVEREGSAPGTETRIVVDPCLAEHAGVAAACVVGYLQSRDEITEVWMKGDLGSDVEALLDAAVESARATRLVLDAVLTESMQARLGGDRAAEDEADLGRATVKDRALADAQMTG